jgi:hypothetical protein
MANMSYCRFENTYSDMVDCLANINRVASNDIDESFRKRLLQIVIGFVESGDAEVALDQIEEKDWDE